MNDEEVMEQFTVKKKKPGLFTLIGQSIRNKIEDTTEDLNRAIQEKAKERKELKDALKDYEKGMKLEYEKKKIREKYNLKKAEVQKSSWINDDHRNDNWSSPRGSKEKQSKNKWLDN